MTRPTTTFVKDPEDRSTVIADRLCVEAALQEENDPDLAEDLHEAADLLRLRREEAVWLRRRADRAEATARRARGSEARCGPALAALEQIADSPTGASIDDARRIATAALVPFRGEPA